LRIASWNVNGLRSAMGKGLMEFLSRGYEVVLLQEVRSDSVPLEIYPGSGYLAYLNPSRRRGYAGTMTLSRVEPISVSRGIGDPRFDDEGRVITIELEEFYVVNVYFPNSQQGLTRLDYKLEFDRAFEGFAQGLRRRKPLVIGGDFNVAHTELDIARPEDNANSAGFTQQERDWMTHFLGLGYVDTFRMFVRDGGHYSWWSYRSRARERNVGWRIDYILVSEELRHRVRGAGILYDVMVSDHAPVWAEIVRWPSCQGAAPGELAGPAGPYHEGVLAGRPPLHPAHDRCAHPVELGRAQRLLGALARRQDLEADPHVEGLVHLRPSDAALLPYQPEDGVRLREPV
jgi:exodeoxyribonuclease-3